MNCRRAGKLLQTLLDGGLREALTAALSAHLDTCPTCRAEHEVLRSLDTALTGEPTVDPPARLAPAVARRAAARHLLAKRLLLPAWLEALTLGGTTVALGAGGFVGVTLLSAVFELELCPAVTAAAVAAAMATGLAIFSSSFYGAEV